MKKIMFYSLTGSAICVASYLTPIEAIDTFNEVKLLYGKDRGELKIMPVSNHERINYVR